MHTSIEMLATALETAVNAADRTPYDIAAAAAGAGHLGRALVALADVEQNTMRGFAVDTVVRQLGRECSALAATAPPAETRPTLLAAALSDAIATMAPATNIVERRVLISRAVDSLTPLLAVVADLPERSQPHQRLEGIEVLADQVQQVMSRNRIDREVTRHVLHRHIAVSDPVAGESSSVEMSVAMGSLLGLTTANKTMTVTEVLQASIACEIVARACRIAEPPPGELLPKHVTAVEGWLAVQATLAAVRDHPAVRGPQADGFADASLIVARAVLSASRADIAAAAQHLPDIADDVFAATQRWTENALDPRTSPLPGERRKPASLDRAIARVSAAVDAAGTLSVVLADDIGHREHHLQPATWTQHHQQAHGHAFRDAAREAQAVAFTYVRPNFLTLTNDSAARHRREEGPTMPRRDAGDKPLPVGYRIAESGVPGTPPKYQVLRGSGRDEQFIGMRDTRPDAEQLAHQHHSRIEAERAARLNTPAARPPTPGRGVGR